MTVASFDVDLRGYIVRRADVRFLAFAAASQRNLDDDLVPFYTYF